MTLTADDLVAKARDQRQRKRYEEALVSAIAAVRMDPESADGWWQVALNRLSLGDPENALEALEQVTSLAPDFVPGWAKYGETAQATGATADACDAFREVLEREEDHVIALNGLTKIYQARNESSEKDLEIQLLSKLDELDEIESHQLNRLGTLHYEKSHFLEAIKYWNRDAKNNDSPSSLFNLGLAYNSAEVTQDADAIDHWRLVLERKPDFERAQERIDAVLPRLLELARAARECGDTILPESQWYGSYLNPYQLLNSQTLEHWSPDEPLDVKTVQRQKKRMLQELELEDGVLDWLPGLRLDKSRALAVCEDLNDERIADFHLSVFRNPNLHAFLTRGCHEHFLVDEQESPLEIMQQFEYEPDFHEWLSHRFAKQFDLVFSTAIHNKALPIAEALLDGRRWVSPQYMDKCFELSRRCVDRMLIPLRDIVPTASSEQPSVSEFKALLEKGALLNILNLLPTQFRDLQSEAASIIRGLAIECFNSHGNADDSLSMLQLTKGFNFKSAELNHRLEEDFAQIDKLIQEERKHTFTLSTKGGIWMISKHGVLKTPHFISPGEISAVRWGVVHERDQSGLIVDQLIAIKGTGDKEIIFKMRERRAAHQETDTEYEVRYKRMLTAIFNYIMPTLCSKICEELSAGGQVGVGPCVLTKSGVSFKTRGIIFSKDHFVPWPSVCCMPDNGDLIVFNEHDVRSRISMSMRDVYNVTMIQFIKKSLS